MNESKTYDLISRQAAIEAIQNAKGGGSAMRKVLFLNAVKDVPTAQHWIPCSERLPEHFDHVLVTQKQSDGKLKITRARYTGKRWIASGRLNKVIAWMPLPEPFKEGES